jgi:midasin
VKENIKRLARVCSSRLPCLIQGDTSIGKTSLIKWLANITGNRLIRINNHENTDLQEYIGSYITNTEGKLEFKEGLLVEAMRHGYWILLDELNLATSEVLEALNRVLDDNRELFIPEIQETIKAHARFVLFATQNPPGKYSGRKQLSRAFRNRFIELHFDELPLNELCEIVEKKCNIPNTYSTLLIQTVFELQTHRSQYNGIFAGKNSLITLRDLFRWAERYSKLDKTVKCDDWKQYLAEQGFLMLSGRCRSNDDVKTIHECIEKVFRRPIDITNLDNPQTLCPPIMSILGDIENYVRLNDSNFVWTQTSRRLALLAGLAYKFDEPFLLVGDTGLGKTTICQLITNLNSKYLHIVNCHMHSEAADFLGKSEEEFLRVALRELL